jgi:hypothetical protein
MSKKMIPLALVALATALFVLPAVASAQEQEIDPGAGTQFTITGGATSITAAGEPTITCETVAGEGEALTKTTATIHIDLKGCHTVVFGLTEPCRSFNAPLKNTIAFAEIVHWITFSSKPAALLTPEFATVICEGLKQIKIGGNGLIGTITEPACNVEAKQMKIKFAVNAGKQEHMLYTTVNYDLTYTTEGAAAVTAAFAGELTLAWAVNIKMTCQ